MSRSGATRPGSPGSASSRSPRTPRKRGKHANASKIWSTCNDMADPTDFGEKAFSAAQNAWRTGQEVAKREARILRLQAEISKLRAQREGVLRQMGEKVF